MLEITSYLVSQQFLSQMLLKILANISQTVTQLPTATLLTYKTFSLLAQFCSNLLFS